jgi:hypothetical protein
VRDLYKKNKIAEVTCTFSIKKAMCIRSTILLKLEARVIKIVDRKEEAVRKDEKRRTNANM